MLYEKIQLEQDETVLAIVRKHWFVFGVQCVSVIVGALIPLILIPVFSLLPLGDFTIPAQATPVFIALYTGWLILSWMTLFGVWTNYYLDVWTVTSKRLITVDQRGLFYRDTGSFRLERLQDINVTTSGIIATFLNFGDLHAETASADRDFVARGIPDPQGLKALIMKSADHITFKPQGAVPQTAAAPTMVHDGL
jgi:uncharacterized membrane protein YdbT with pleckstrin-like domain